MPINSLWHRWYIHRQVPEFLRACPQPIRGEVLEVGAGAGWTSRQILATFPQVELTATDIDQRATKRFAALERQYGRRLKVLPADARSLPFDRASFDIVLAINVMTRLEAGDQAEVIRQMLRVLHPGGWLGVTPAPLPLQRLVIQEVGQSNLPSGLAKSSHLWIHKPYLT